MARVVVSADVSWATKIGARREAELGCKEKRFERPTSKAAEDGLEAKRARRGGRGYVWRLYSMVTR